MGKQRPVTAGLRDLPRFTWGTLLCLIVVTSAAAGGRVWYLIECVALGDRPPALRVQEEPRAAPDDLVANIGDYGAFDCIAPLADEEEPTAHVAPGYSFLRSLIVSPDANYLTRWLQCVLGSLTVVCYFFFTRRMFHSTFIATLTGLLTACHPFWIINTAEINDGVLATFLVSVCLALGVRGGQVGGPVTGLGFGLALAAASLVRAALLPFAVVSLLWFLWASRRHPLGWLAGLLAILGFVNGVAPWAIRNYLILEQPIPIVDSACLHLWMGNNPQATGSTLTESSLRSTFSDDRLAELLTEPNQARRYQMLASDVQEEVQDHPTETLGRRVQAALMFVLGERWFEKRELAVVLASDDQHAAMPDWLRDNIEAILQSTLVSMILLALVGWRWSYPWRRYGSIGVLALLLIPLPYVLSHAESQSGPRLPLDGVILCYAAYALAGLIPGLVRAPGAK